MHTNTPIIPSNSRISRPSHAPSSSSGVPPLAWIQIQSGRRFPSHPLTITDPQGPGLGHLFAGARWWRWLIVAVAVETQAAVPWVPRHHSAGPPDGFRCESAEPQVERDPADERASVSGRLCERLKVSLLSIKGFLFCIISANETCTWVN